MSASGSKGNPGHLSGEPVTPAVWLPSTRLIAIVAFLAFLLKIALALRTFGTNDVYNYERFMIWSQHLGVDVYRPPWDWDRPPFMHPPFILHMLRVLAWLVQTTGMSFAFWLRVPGIFADSVSLWLVWKILGPRAQKPSIRWALLMLAGAPALVVMSGFHGNTDTVMIMFVLLSVYLIEKGRLGEAGAAFALSMSFKLIPVIAIPAIYLYLDRPRRRLVFFSVVGAALVLLWSPYIFQDPSAILRRMLGYRSLYGHWGFSFLSTHFLGDDYWLNGKFRKWGAHMALAAIGLISLGMDRIRPKPSLFSQVGLIFFCFLSLTNGFGVQHLVWLMPWAVGLGAVPAMFFYAAGGAFLVLVYNYWSNGLPWYLADAIRMGDYQGHLDYFQLLCWLSVLYLLVTACMQIQADRPSPRWLVRRIPASVTRMSIALAMFAFVVFPAALQWQRDSRPLGRPDGDQAARAMRATAFSEVSSRLYAANRYRDAMETARQALALDPTNAEAYTIVAASSAALGLWEQAIENARQALRLQPDSAQAQATLARGLSETQKQSPQGKP